MNPLDEGMRAFCAFCNWMHFWIREGIRRKRISQQIKSLSILDKYIIMLLAADDKPIPSLIHLKGELIVCARIDPELQKYIDEHGGIKLP